MREIRYKKLILVIDIESHFISLSGKSRTVYTCEVYHDDDFVLDCRGGSLADLSQRVLEQLLMYYYIKEKEWWIVDKLILNCYKTSQE